MIAWSFFVYFVQRPRIPTFSRCAEEGTNRNNFDPWTPGGELSKQVIKLVIHNTTTINRAKGTALHSFSVILRIDSADQIYRLIAFSKAPRYICLSFALGRPTLGQLTPSVVVYSSNVPTLIAIYLLTPARVLLFFSLY